MFLEAERCGLLSIHGLVVRFGGLTAVDDLSLEVPEGCLFGLLGPNGAGKTTTISCVAGLRTPTAGEVRLGGRVVADDPDATRELLGVVPQAIALYPTLTVLQNLRVIGGLHGLGARRLQERVEWALALAQLEGRSGARVDTLSGGMKRRLNLASSLLHDPEVLLCDEPTAGVDPQSRNHLFETLRALNAEGRTVVYTTHYMEEAEALCSRVAIIDHGRLVACDALDTLLATPEAPTRFDLEVAGGRSPAELAAALEAAGIAGAEVRPAPRSLEQVFLELTGRALRDGE